MHSCCCFSDCPDRLDEPRCRIRAPVLRCGGRSVGPSPHAVALCSWCHSPRRTIPDRPSSRGLVNLDGGAPGQPRLCAACRPRACTARTRWRWFFVPLAHSTDVSPLTECLRGAVGVRSTDPWFIRSCLFLAVVRMSFFDMVPPYALQHRPCCRWWRTGEHGIDPTSFVPCCPPVPPHAHSTDFPACALASPRPPSAA